MTLYVIGSFFPALAARDRVKVYTFEGVSVREQLRVASHHVQVVVSIDPKDRRTGYFTGISGHQ
jgi:hypothetical protein